MKVFLITFLLALLLSACTAFSPLSISESTLEGYLQQQVVRFDQQQLQTGSPLSVSLKQVDVTLGPDGREVIVLSANGEVAVNALLTKIPVDVFLKVEGMPVYKSDEKAIYIRRLNLLDSRVESTLFKGDLKPLTDNLMRALAQLLETMPVYRLDEQNMAGQLMEMTNLNLKVIPGKLVFVPVG